MKIVVAHHHRTLVGGIETYLAAVMPRLVEAGHELLFAPEAPDDRERQLIPLPKGVATVGLEKGIEDAMEKIRAWRPKLVYAHALHVPQFQRALVESFPTVLFAHGYYGLCISGSKTWKRAPAAPCQKSFDWTCLLHFHAHRCGGANPVTMVRDYFLHSRQLATLKKCKAILTHGGLMQREYIAAGIPAERVLALPHFVESPTLPAQKHELGDLARLLFVGRFDELKGGATLLEALPLVARDLGRAVILKMVGAGPAAGAWKKIAERVSSQNARVEFTGWAERDAKDRLMAESDLLVAPSVWPEPFGQVGLEAAGLGLPAAAFDVGGISTWLREGINGHLAPADPPRAQGLSAAIVKALGNGEHYGKLRAGAERVAREFTVERHLDALNKVFAAAANQK
jgi:glycosyltransferase involved in cell wall biosynthesis